MTALARTRCAYAGCLVWFEPVSARQKYHSMECGEAARKTMAEGGPLADKVAAIARSNGIDIDLADDGRDELPGVELLRAERRQASDLVDRWLAISPRKFRDARLVDVEQPDTILEGLNAWLAAARCEEAGNLILSGGYGCGKTYAALALAHELHFDGYHVAYTTVVSLLDGLRPGGGLDRRRFERAGVLFLDDVGVEKPSEWTEQELTQLIDARYTACLPIVATTNLSGEQLRHQIGERAFERLRDQANTLIFPGASRRRPATVASAQLSLYREVR